MANPDALWQVPFQAARPAGPNVRPTIVTVEDNVIDFPGLARNNPDAHIVYQEDGGAIVDLSGGREAGKADDEFTANMAEHMDDLDLGRLAEDLLEGIDADLRSREEWIENRDRAVDLLGLKIEKPRSGPGGGGAPLQGMSTAKDPSMLEAVIRGQANAIGEFLPAEGPAKIEDVGDITADELAELLEKDYNYFLTTVATEYYPDTKQMFAWLYFGGSGFKKVYNCPLRRRPVSESVDAKDLVVSNAATDLMNANRVTHLIEMRKSEFKRMVVAGMYRDDVAAPAPTAPDKDRLTHKLESIEGVRSDNQRPEDQPYTIYECRCEAEFDWDRFVPRKFKGKGVPLPYCVSIEKDSRRILAIYRDWKQDDDDARRKRTFIKFSYIDWMGFYGIGLLHVMGNLTMALTAMLRISIDNGMFSNFPGGVMPKNPAQKQATNEMIAGPGQFVGVDMQGLDDIRKVVMGLPYQDIKQGFLLLMDKVREVCTRVGGTADLPVAEGRADIPVGTILALIEQATKVESAVHKGLHSAFSEEHELMMDLFREDPEALYRYQKKVKKKGGVSTWNEAKVLQALNDYDLVPRSDPNTPSHIHRVMKVVAMLQMAQSAPPGTFDIRAVYRAALEVLGYKDGGGFLLPPPNPAAPPPPSPEMIEANAKMLDAQTKSNTAMGNLQVKQQEVGMKGAAMQNEQQVADTNLAKELVIHQADAAKDQRVETRDAARQAREEARADATAVAKAQTDRTRAETERTKVGLSVAAHHLNLRSHALDAATAAHDAAMDVHGINNPKPESAP
jgi:hypothetical protein